MINNVSLRRQKEGMMSHLKQRAEGMKRDHWRDRARRFGYPVPLNEDQCKEMERAIERRGLWVWDYV